jgi:hypothetical protein
MRFVTCQLRKFPTHCYDATTSVLSCFRRIYLGVGMATSKLNEDKLNAMFYDIYCEAVEQWKKSQGKSIKDLDFSAEFEEFAKSDFGTEFKSWSQSAFENL